MSSSLESGIQEVLIVGLTGTMEFHRQDGIHPTSNLNITLTLPPHLFQEILYYIPANVLTLQLTVQLLDQKIQTRLKNWAPPQPYYTSGVMAKYAKLVSSASQGAVTS